MRSCTDVHNFLCEAGVAHEIVHLPALADTARRAADLLGVPPADVVKTLLFYLDTRPALVLVPGDRQASPELICAAAGCSEVVLARPFEVVQLTGFMVGALPPCGLALPLPAYADPDVFAPPVVYCGGGTTTTMLKLRSDDLLRVAGALVAPVAEPAAGASGRPGAAAAAQPAGRATTRVPAAPDRPKPAGEPGRAGERGAARRADEA